MNPAPSIAPYIGPITIGIVLTAAAIDLQQRRIPNWLTFGAWLLALPLQLLLHGLGAGMQTWLYGWLCGLALFLPFYLLRGMAAGDVKLMAAVGALLGAGPALHVALATFLIGGAWALVLVLKKGMARQAARNLIRLLPVVGCRDAETNRPGPGQTAPHSVGSLPYGVAIAAGTLYVLFASA